jgi:hypothetical protein
MKRFVITAAAFALISVFGFSTSTALAHGPHHHGFGGSTGVLVVGGGGYGGYGGYGYSPNGYGGYVAPYLPPSAPYGAGFSGGYQPYQQMYYQRLYYGLGTR